METKHLRVRQADVSSPDRLSHNAQSIAFPAADQLTQLPSAVKFRRLKTDAFPDQPIGQGAPPSTIPNVRYILDSFGIVARYNVIKKRTEVVVPAVAEVVDNLEGVTLAHVKSALALHGIPNGDTRAIVEAIASDHTYNPVAEWIDSKPWDGTDRLSDFYETLTAEADFSPQLKETIMYRWALSAVSAALKVTGFSSRLVLTLSGPQSIGKTRWTMALVPDPALRAAVIKTDHHFEGGSKDQIISAFRFWIVELGEVTSSFQKDAERLKGIITRDRDVVRLPYAAAESEWARRTVFVATTNTGDFLNDPTGSTRWGTIPVTHVDYEHGIDMQQLWAQLAVDVRAEVQWWLTPAEEEMLEVSNERHQATSVVRDSIAAVLDPEPGSSANWVRVTATEVLQAAGIESPTNPQARDAGAILRQQFGSPVKSRGSFRWSVPLLSAAHVRDQSPEPMTSSVSKFD